MDIPSESDVSVSFEKHRSALFKLCYRMTGSAADADDAVQETFARLLERPPTDLERDLKPWLVQVALNLSRDQLRQRKRRAYVGPWLPAPIETDGFTRGLAPDARYSELESVSMAFLIALEALSSSQRGVLLLRDVLGYSVDETAQALALSESNVKTTHHRARAALETYDRERSELTPELQQKTREALQRFLTLLMMGDVEGLKTLFAADAVSRSDGAGEFFAAQRPIVGAERIIKFSRKVQRASVPRFALREINGLPAVVGLHTTPSAGAADAFVMTLLLDRQGLIRSFDIIVATRKLSHMRFAF